MSGLDRFKMKLRKKEKREGRKKEKKKCSSDEVQRVQVIEYGVEAESKTTPRKSEQPIR